MSRGMLSKLLGVLLALGVCGCFLCRVSTARADNLYGSIRGTVTDPTGSDVPGVAVTATNELTGAPETATTKDDGSFSFVQLAIGFYDVSAEKTGFKKFTATKIHLDENQVYVLNVKMEIGSVSQEVSVQASPVQVETTTPQLGIVLESNEILDLPLLGRNWVNLQATQPGVVGSSDRFGANADFATNGGESQFNVFLVDGTETNDIALNTPGFIASEDALTEFQMVTSTVNPEYARSGGAIVSALIKSGTNSFHGDAFEFYRDTFLNATQPYTDQKEIFHQNQFGGTIGGPIIKNHLFGFFSYQGIRNREPESGVATSVNVFAPGQATGTVAFPNLSTSSGVLPFSLPDSDTPGVACPAGTKYSTCFSTGIVPAADINSISQSLLKYVPAPTNLTTNQFAFQPINQTVDDQYIARVDQTFNAHDSIWATWIQESEPFNQEIPFVGATLPGFPETNPEHFKFATAAWNHIFNDHLTNELRFGYNRFNYAAVYPVSPTAPSSAGFQINPQITNGEGLPVVAIPGLFNLGFSEDGPQPRIDQDYQAVDNLSVVTGRHTLKFGFDGRRYEVWNPFASVNDGLFSFGTGVANPYITNTPGVNFLLGIPDFYDQGSGSIAIDQARLYYSYAQDEFKLKSNLTLTYGVGWTIDTPMESSAFGGHGQVGFVPGQQSVVFPNAPVGVVYLGDPGVHPAGATHPWRYFGPRLGIAYSPDLGWLSGGPGRLSIRAGFGIYYDRSEEEQAGQVVGMPPFAISSTGAPQPSFANPFNDVCPTSSAFCTGNGAVNVKNPFPFPGPTSNVQFTTAAGFLPIFTFCCAVISPNLVDPMMENYNLTIERQIGSSSVLTLAYVGSVGHHLSYGLPQNLATLTGPASCDGEAALGNCTYDGATYGSIDTIYSEGNSRYNSFQASWDKRLSHGFQVLASYTYSHSIDDTSGFENSTFGEFGINAGGFSNLRASNPYCFPQCDYANSIFDARQRLVISYVYHIPGLSKGWAVSRITQGWAVAGITIFQKGFPLDIVDLSEPSGGCMPAVSDYSCWDGPNQVSSVTYSNPRSTPTNVWFSASSFAPVTAGANPASVVNYGNAPRNPLLGPGDNNWDLQLFKDTTITESTKLELRIEFYNVFNHLQYKPAGVINDISGFSGPFGTETQAYAPRLIQLAAKVYF